MLSRLLYCSKDSEATIINVNGGWGAHENLNSLGLEIGNKVKITKGNVKRGPVKVDFLGKEILIGRELAAKTIVETSNEINTTLDKVRVNDIVEVTRMRSNGDIRYRLLDMGLTKGTTAKVIRLAPLGDPIEIDLNGFNLSLRIEEASSIDVKVLKISTNGNERKKWWWNH
ncbi:ferrous iron transport protein A [Bacteroidota bacterium]